MFSQEAEWEILEKTRLIFNISSEIVENFQSRPYVRQIAEKYSRILHRRIFWLINKIELMSEVFATTWNLDFL